MRIIRAYPILALAAATACVDLGGPDDTNIAGIYWTEATSTPDEVAVRVLGHTGCSGLDDLNWTLQPGAAAVLELNPRARPNNGDRCIVAPRFDRTITFARPSESRSLTIREVKPGWPSRDLLDLSLSSPHRHMGGLLTVDRTDALCTTASPGFDLVYDPWYSVFTARAHPWRVGEFVQVAGYVDADPWPTCGTDETMIITRITYNPA